MLKLRVRRRKIILYVLETVLMSTAAFSALNLAEVVRNFLTSLMSSDLASIVGFGIYLIIWLMLLHFLLDAFDALELLPSRVFYVTARILLAISTPMLAVNIVLLCT